MILNKDTWEFDDSNLSEKLIAIGAPENPNIDEVVNVRHYVAAEIVERLQLTKSSRVLDLGSGMGFIAEKIAPQVERVYCVDISETFLNDCRKRLTMFNNVEFHQISYGDLLPIYDKGIDAVYSSLLFIHFNFYDIYFYLTELNKVLTVEGLLYFDYNDGERFSLAVGEDSFHSHLSRYKEYLAEHKQFPFMHMTSFETLKNLAPQLGFKVVNNWVSDTCFSRILLQKDQDLL